MLGIQLFVPQKGSMSPLWIRTISYFPIILRTCIHWLCGRAQMSWRADVLSIIQKIESLKSNDRDLRISV